MESERDVGDPRFTLGKSNST